MNDIHIGHAIKEELDRQGRKTSWFIQQIGKSKSATYRLFESASIDTNDLRRISDVLNYDFFKLYTKE